MSPPPTIDTDQPLNNFSHCHAGILNQLEQFSELPALLALIGRAHQIAESMVQLFGSAAFDHHQEEEYELFPAVLSSSQPGEERERVKALIDALTREHRDVEKQWNKLEPQLKKVAKGQLANVDVEAVRHLVEQYKAHARLEEMEFLPLSEKILSRNGNHMAALGLSLHMRHQRTLPPYI
jgi:hypothetical protein